MVGFGWQMTRNFVPEVLSSAGLDGRIVVGLYLLLGYVVGAPFLYMTMLRQRRRKLGKKPSARML